MHAPACYLEAEGHGWDAGTDEAPISRDKLRRNNLDGEGGQGASGGCFEVTSCAPGARGVFLRDYWSERVDVLPRVLGLAGRYC